MRTTASEEIEKSNSDFKKSEIMELEHRSTNTTVLLLIENKVGSQFLHKIAVLNIVQNLVANIYDIVKPFTLLKREFHNRCFLLTL